MAAVVVPVLFLLLVGVCGGLVVLYLRHRRLQHSFTAFANSHYNSRLGSAIFSSGDELGKTSLLPFMKYVFSTLQNTSQKCHLSCFSTEITWNNLSQEPSPLQLIHLHHFKSVQFHFILFQLSSLIVYFSLVHFSSLFTWIQFSSLKFS